MAYDALLGNVINLLNEFNNITHLTVMRRLKVSYKDAVKACNDLQQQGKLEYEDGFYYVA